MRVGPGALGVMRTVSGAGGFGCVSTVVVAFGCVAVGGGGCGSSS